MASPGGVKRILRQALAALGLEVRRVRPAFAQASNFDEERIVRDLLGRIPVRNRFCVDIGAGDGETMSNSFSLFRSGWDGLAAECDGSRFATLADRYARDPGVRLTRARITPDNVLDILSCHDVPREIGFLSLDIDGYDHYVLERILSGFRPALICTEINEKIPPPIKFAVQWYPEYRWAGDHFYGQSLAQLQELVDRSGYALVGLEYNNAFLIPKESNPLPVLTPDLAFQQGYLEKPDRLARLPWNRDMEHLLDLSPDEAAVALGNLFEKYAGRFVLSAR